MPWPKGKKRSAATREKIAQANRDRWSDPKYRARLSESQKKSWKDPEIRRSRVEPRVGQKRTVETKKKMSEVQKKVDRSKPDMRKVRAMNEARRGSHNTPGQNEKISKAKKQWHKDHPELSRELIDEATKANKYFDNKLELQVATILDDLGIGYVKQHREPSLPKPHRSHKWDFRVAGARVLIEVDGCWWHGCEKHAPVSRRRELREQTSKQSRRDRVAEERGWKVLRLWEHDLKSDPTSVAAVVVDVVGGARSARRSA